MSIAQPSAPAESDHQPFTAVDQIAEQDSSGEMSHFRPARDLHHQFTP